MREGSSWIRFTQDLSHDMKRGFARLRALSWQALPIEYKALLLLIMASVLLLLISVVPQWQAASWEGIVERKDLPRLENDARAIIVQAIGGAALIIGLLFTWRNLRMTEQNSRQTLELSRKGQINDRFIKAVEQLGAVDQSGNKKLEVRLGGIYALEQIAIDSPEDHHWPIMEILTAYVRARAAWKIKPQRSEPLLAPDIQAILTVLGRRTRTYRKGEDHGLDLARTDLCGAHLIGSHLEGADLTDTHLESASLMGAHLEHAFLRDTHLEEAILMGAHLKSAYLKGADFQGVDLRGVRNLTVEQLVSVKTLYRARLDLPLLEQIQQQYPHLLEPPQREP